MTKILSYEFVCFIAHVLEMLYARDGRGMYITVDSNRSERIIWTTLDVGKSRHQGRVALLVLSRSKNASWGRSTRPILFILRFASFWFSRCFIFRS